MRLRVPEKNKQKKRNFKYISKTSYDTKKKHLRILQCLERKQFFSPLVFAVIALFHLSDGSGHKQGVAQVGWFFHDGVGSWKAVRAIKVLQSRQWIINDLLSYAGGPLEFFPVCSCVAKPNAKGVCMDARYSGVTKRDKQSLDVVVFMRILMLSLCWVFTTCVVFLSQVKQTLCESQTKSETLST